MSIEDPKHAAQVTRDAAHWARAVSRLSYGGAPAGALNRNVTGKRVASPIQGFGKLWQKTYTARLVGADITPTELISIWKAEFGSFWPKSSRFYGSLAGIQPGETALLNLDLPGHLPIATGVLVLYVDDESFTFMTPEGHGFAGFITFSAAVDHGTTCAQVTALLRAADPIGELGMMLGVARLEDRNWETTLRNLAHRVGADNVTVTITKTQIDPRRQWNRFGNIWQNSMLRTLAYTLTHPRWRTRSGK
jgi:hypothetical protein